MALHHNDRHSVCVSVFPQGHLQKFELSLLIHANLVANPVIGLCDWVYSIYSLVASNIAYQQKQHIL